MKRFYGRKEEISILKEIGKRSKEHSQFTVLSGNRRVGKTTLIRNVFGDENILYFYISIKPEYDLCSIFMQEIENKLGIPMLGGSTKLEQLFDYVMRLSEKQHLTVFIDEFQRLGKIDSSIYSDIQKVWDLRKDKAHINLIAGGSAKTMLLRLFEDHSQPLFGRQTATLRVEHFMPSTLKEILNDYNPDYSHDDLLALYSFTGGVARYVELLMDAKAFTKDAMLKEIIRSSSVFLSEGRNHLLEEFGQDYATYFTILSTIATGHSTRSEIEDAIGKGVGGQLAMLEDTYAIIKKHTPMFSTNNKNVRYRLEDNFYVFWFRFIYSYNYMLEIKAYDKLIEIINRDYETFSGKILERYFREVLIESRKFTRIDSWWDRKGTIDIDIIAEDELLKHVEFIEVKRQAKKYNPQLLEERKEEFINATHAFNKYDIVCKGLSMEDM